MKDAQTDKVPRHGNLIASPLKPVFFVIKLLSLQFRHLKVNSVDKKMTEPRNPAFLGLENRTTWEKAGFLVRFQLFVLYT